MLGLYQIPAFMQLTVWTVSFQRLSWFCGYGGEKPMGTLDYGCGGSYSASE